MTNKAPKKFMEALAFQSDRLRLLGALVSPRAIELARKRVVNHKERLSDVDDDPATVRIALLLVKEMNPFADLTNAEMGILMGLNAETVGTRKAAGEL